MATCTIQSCMHGAVDGGLCDRHHRFWASGQLLGDFPRPSEVEACDEGARLHIRQRDFMIHAVALIDREDMALVDRHFWQFANGEVICRTANRKVLTLKQYLLGACKQQVAVLNDEELDLRRSNLRVMTNRELRLLTRVREYADIRYEFELIGEQVSATLCLNDQRFACGNHDCEAQARAAAFQIASAQIEQMLGDLKRRRTRTKLARVLSRPLGLAKVAGIIGPC